MLSRNPTVTEEETEAQKYEEISQGYSVKEEMRDLGTGKETVPCIVAPHRPQRENRVSGELAQPRM